MKNLPKIMSILILAGVGVFLLIQLIPIGRDYTNPAVVRDAPWPSAEARQIAQRACYDCHSYETAWPWYSRIAPVSWMVQNHVREGRSELNFSNWGRGEQEMEKAVEVVREGEMPLPSYLPAHPKARLTAAEQATLIEALIALGADPEGEDRRGRDDD